ncbi:MAG: hypothetical protein ABL986_06235 [Vicinamibacterales bacterium]
MSRAFFGVAVLCTTLLFVGCDDAPTAPTPEVPVITESFSGTLTINGAITHPFVVGTPAAVTATLTAVSPDNTIPIGISLGTWSTQFETCQVVISNDLASEGRTIVGSAQTAGAFCVRAYDTGRLTEPTSYTLVVEHK